MRDREARSGIERHLVGAGKAQRPPANLRDRVAAALQRRPHVPVAADHEHRQPHHPGGRESAPLAAEEDHADRDRRDRYQEGELHRRRQPRGDAGEHQRPLVEQRRVALGRVLDRRPGGWGASLMAVDHEGREGDQEGEAHDVVAALARLQVDQHPRGEDQGRGNQRRRADLVGATDAPRGEQGDRQPAEVDQRREPVVVHQQDPGRVDQFRALRVKPGNETQRVGVEQVDRRVFLGHPRREGHVVPGGIPPEHPLFEAEQRRDAPLGDGDRGDPQRDPQGALSATFGAAIAVASRGARRQPSRAASSPRRCRPRRSSQAAGCSGSRAAPARGSAARW